MNQVFPKKIWESIPLYPAHTISRLVVVRKVCLWLAMTIAGVILAAWLISPVRQFYPTGWDLMKANTAICILLTALLLLNNQTLANRKIVFVR